jgi:RNA-directed DNA polymerase
MSKSLKHVWSVFTSWENWFLAYRNCRRRKRYKRSAIEFDFQWETSLSSLRQEVIDGNWMPGEYHNFRIYDPKPRTISAAPFRDRIVHHALINVLEPFFDRRFIYDSYACRRGKGTHRAISRAQYYLRRNPFFLKTDIIQFFPNVDHEIMLTAIRRGLQDDQLLGLIDRIINSSLSIKDSSPKPIWYSGDGLLDVLRPKGLPIGNLTSQFFANVLLDRVDHSMKEKYRAPGYIRYADDFLLFGKTKQQLWDLRRKLESELESLRLSIHPNKTHVGHSEHGVRFLGCRLFPDQKKISQVSLRRMRGRIKHWRHQAWIGKIEFKDIRNSLIAWDSYASFCNSKQIRHQMIKSLRLRFRGSKRGR